MNTLISIFRITMMYSTPLIFAALGGVVSERSGIVNIALEGIMCIGAFTGATVSIFTGNPWLAFLCSGVAGCIFSLLLAISSITFRGGQTISGIALNFLGLGLATYMCRLLFKGSAFTSGTYKMLPFILPNDVNSTNPAIQILNLRTSEIMALLITLLIWFTFYKTKFGLKIRAIGEHPRAADTLGINVYAIRYVCVLCAGFLAGLGGGSMTLSIVSSFSPTVISGHGFIALAAVIFGKWTPHGAAAACLFFGAAQAVTVVVGGTSIDFPVELLATVPYILTLVVLVVFVGKASSPKALGVTYK